MVVYLYLAPADGQQQQLDRRMLSYASGRLAGSSLLDDSRQQTSKEKSGFSAEELTRVPTDVSRGSSGGF